MTITFWPRRAMESSTAGAMGYCIAGVAMDDADQTTVAIARLVAGSTVPSTTSTHSTRP